MSLRDVGDPVEITPILERNSYDLKRINIRSKIQLVTFIILMVAFGVASSIFRKKMMNSFGIRYVFFRQELTNLLYNLYATIIVLYKLLYTNSITPEMRAFPLWKFGMLGFFDGFADFLTSVGGVYTPGEWQVLLSQLVIIFTIIFAFFILQQRYNIWQIAGTFGILVGVAIAIVPTFLNGSGTKNMIWYFVLVYSVSNVPASLSAVYKDKYFKVANIDVFWLTSLVSWSQLVLSWAFVPLLSIPYFGGTPLSLIPEIMVNGAKCFIGDSSIPVYNDNNQVIGNCSVNVPIYTMLYSSTGFLSGIASLYVISQGSAVLYVIATAVQLPLSNLAFTIPFIMMNDVEEFSWWNVGGLVCVFIGFVLYSYFSMELKEAPAKKIVKDVYIND